MNDERFDIDVGYRDPWDRRDDFPEYEPSPDEYEDQKPPWAPEGKEWCVSCFREWKPNGENCPRCGWPNR